MTRWASLGWIAAILFGLTCSTLLFAGPQMITWLSGPNPPVGPAMISMCLSFGALIGLGYGGIFGMAALVRLISLNWKLKDSSQLERTPTEERVYQDVRGQLAELMRTSYLLILWSRERFRIYEHMRDSGQIDRHIDERDIRSLIDTTAREIAEELSAVEGLLMTHKSFSAQELEGLINAIHARGGDVRAIANRLHLISRMDPSVQHEHHLAANKYNFPRDPDVGALELILKRRLRFA